MNFLIPLLNKMTCFNNPDGLKKEMLFYTYDEFSNFIAQEKELKYKVYFEMLYYCGLRKGEANALNWNDIDFENSTVNINKSVCLKIKAEKYRLMSTKTKASVRTLPIPKSLQNDLFLLKNQYSSYTNYSSKWFVFGGIYPLSDSTVNSHRDKCCKSANVKRIRIHDFRHSCASLLINNGANINLVSKYLGHSNITTTLNVYTHMYKNQFNDIVKVINNLDK